MAVDHPLLGSERPSHPTRRAFVKTIGTAALAASVPRVGLRSAMAQPGASTAPGTAVARFYDALTDEQRRRLCFPSDHPKRSQVSNNWAIVRPTIGDLPPEQRSLCREIFENLCSEEGYERFQRQMNDDHGGFENYHVAVFGAPGTDQPFEWVLTGRHVTLRADGNRGGGVACGGPLFTGHAAEGHAAEDPEHPHNVWWYQGRQAGMIFATLDATQRRQALVAESGLPVSTLDGPQKRMVQQLLCDLVRPFRAFDAEEVRGCLDMAGGADALRLTFFTEGGTRDAPVPEVWKLEGPAFAWYFHGSPHVHSWIDLSRCTPRG